jgi:hypothetical protein
MDRGVAPGTVFACTEQHRKAHTYVHDLSRIGTWLSVFGPKPQCTEMGQNHFE